MADVFVSYSSKDRGRVQLIVDQLRQHGVDVFWDQSIKAGESWDKSDAIRRLGAELDKKRL